MRAVVIFTIRVVIRINITARNLFITRIKNKKAVSRRVLMTDVHLRLIFEAWLGLGQKAIRARVNSISDQL